MTVIARIGIGSNIGDTAANVEDAFLQLSTVGRVIVRSDLYGSKAWGVTDQPDFHNAVAIIETELSPRELLIALKNIEQQMGRTPTYHWGPRVIDLDILTFGDQRVNEPDLVIPHAHMMQRAFVLAPLADIDPAYVPALAALSDEERQQVWRVPSSA